MPSSSIVGSMITLGRYSTRLGVDSPVATGVKPSEREKERRNGDETEMDTYVFFNTRAAGCLQCRSFGNEQIYSVFIVLSFYNISFSLKVELMPWWAFRDVGVRLHCEPHIHPACALGMEM